MAMRNVKIPSHFLTPSHFLSRYIGILQLLPFTFSGEINREMFQFQIYTHRNEQLKIVPFRVRRAAAGGGPDYQRDYKNDTWCRTRRRSMAIAGWVYDQ